jgi:hypothetical protein
MESWLLRKIIKEEKAVADAEIDDYQRRQWKAYETSNREHEKCERYCREQRDVLRTLEELATNERAMYELDNRKDQVMTVFKVALTNLVMWTRDNYFPESFAHASLPAAGSVLPPARSCGTRTEHGVRRTASFQ